MMHGDNNRITRFQRRCLGAWTLLAPWLVGCLGEKFQSCEHCSNAAGDSSATTRGLVGNMAGAAGAGSSEHDPRDDNQGQGGHSSDGPSASTGAPSGVAGEAGAGTVSIATECRADRDCDDGLFCNGEEHCAAGECVRAAKPCTNPDAAHCQVQCEEDSETCSVSARDGDGDGFTSAQCEAAPGPDCDDADFTIHPNASELCDGLDNNCNALLDLEDAMSLGGTTHTMPGGREPHLAFNGATGEFSILLGLEPGSVYLGEVSPNGLGALATLGSPTDEVSYQPVALLPTSTGFGGLYTRRGVQTYESFFMVNGAPGSPAQTTRINNFRGVALGGGHNGQWLIAGYSDPESVDSNTPLEAWQGGLGSFAERGPIPGRESGFALAISGQEAALAWQQAGSILWAQVVGAPVIPSGTEVAQVPTSPALVGFSEGYALGWPDADGFSVAEYHTGGEPRCGPTQVLIGAGSVHPDDQLSLAANAERLYALHTRHSGQVSLAVLDRDCQLLEQHLVHEHAANPQHPSLAVGQGELALAWAEAQTATDSVVRTRVLTEQLCR